MWVATYNFVVFLYCEDFCMQPRRSRFVFGRLSALLFARESFTSVRINHFYLALAPRPMDAYVSWVPSIFVLQSTARFHALSQLRCLVRAVFSAVAASLGALCAIRSVFEVFFLTA